jgi:hypothetical protein
MGYTSYSSQTLYTPGAHPISAIAEECGEGNSRGTEDLDRLVSDVRILGGEKLQSDVAKFNEQRNDMVSKWEKKIVGISLDEIGKCSLLIH